MYPSRMSVREAMLNKRAARKLASGVGENRNATTKGMEIIRKKDNRLGRFFMIARFCALATTLKALSMIPKDDLQSVECADGSGSGPRLRHFLRDEKNHLPEGHKPSRA